MSVPPVSGPSILQSSEPTACKARQDVPGETLEHVEGIDGPDGVRTSLGRRHRSDTVFYDLEESPSKRQNKPSAVSDPYILSDGVRGNLGRHHRIDTVYYDLEEAA